MSAALRWIAALLLALAIAAPAQAQQTGLPLWLIGTWCGELGGAQETKQAPMLCDQWVAGDDGTLQNRIASTDDSGLESTGSIAVEDGKLVLRGGRDGKISVNFREISRGPSEVVFENLMEGPLDRLVLRREGDDLVEEIWLRDRAAPQRTVYHLKK
ncbi:MAG: hypothetical protein ACAH11_14545 [Sphingomonas sp.]